MRARALDGVVEKARVRPGRGRGKGRRRANMLSVVVIELVVEIGNRKVRRWEEVEMLVRCW